MPAEETPLLPGLNLPERQGEVVYISKPLEREGVLAGFTYKLRWPGSDHAMYITINDIERDGRRRPFEVFINSKNLEHYAWTVALTRMISAIFRRGGDVTFVVEELKAIFDPQGGQWMGGRYVPSLLAAIGQVIERHMIRTGFLNAPPRPGLGAECGAPGAGCGRSAAGRHARRNDGRGHRQGVSALRLTLAASPRGLLGVQRLRLLQVQLKARFEPQRGFAR